MLACENVITPHDLTASRTAFGNDTLTFIYCMTLSVSHCGGILYHSASHRFSPLRFAAGLV